MKKNYLLLLLAFIPLMELWAQDEGEKQTVIAFQGKFKISEKEPFTLNISFAKGDKVNMSFRTTNNKEIKQATVTALSDQLVFSSKNTTGQSNVVFYVPYDQVYRFTFVGPKMWSRLMELTVTRTPAKPDTYLFNPASAMQHTFNVLDIETQKDSVVAINVVSDKRTELQIFDTYLYQQVPILKKSFQLKGAFVGGSSRYFHFSIPKAPVPEAKLRYWSYLASSKIGGAKHWSVAKTTVGIGTAFIHPGASLAATAYMDFLGPQDNGEPSQFYLSKNEEDVKNLEKRSGEVLKKIGELGKGMFTSLLKGKSLNSYFKERIKENKFTLTGTYRDIDITSVYGISNALHKDNYLFMSNSDPHKAKNVKFELNALYYVPKYKTAWAKQKEFNPVVQQFTEKQQVIRTISRRVPMDNYLQAK